MAVTVRCPNPTCGKVCVVADDQAGRNVACPTCRRPFRAPAALAREQPPAVYATAATVDLARILLPDAGHLQEEEARFRNKHRLTKHKPALPLYTVEDAVASLELLRPVAYGSTVVLYDP